MFWCLFTCAAGQGHQRGDAAFDILPDGLGLGLGVGRGAGQTLVELHQHRLERRQRVAGGRGALAQPLAGLGAGLVDQLGRLLDDLARLGQPRIEGDNGLLPGGEGGFAKLIHLAARRRDMAFGGLPRLGGAGGEHADRVLGAFFQRLALTPGQFGDHAHRVAAPSRPAGRARPRRSWESSRRCSPAAAMVWRNTSALWALAVAAQFGRAAAGPGNRFAQLGAQRFGFHRIGLVVGAQAVGGRDQGGALFGQALLDGSGLIDDAQPRGFQPVDLAGQVVGGGFCRVAGLAGGGGEIGGAGGERGLGLAHLRLGQV